MRRPLALVVLLAPACNGAPASAPGGAAGAAAAAPAAHASVEAPPRVPAPLPAAPAPAGPLGCRVVSATGSAARDSGNAVRAGDRFVGSDWLELGKGSSLHLKHGASGREWTLSGPARVLPCVDGQEELIVAEGKLRTEAGAGVRPGAQVLIGTPFGSLRYADASAELEISSEALKLRVSAGDTWLSPAPGVAGGRAGQPGAETHTLGSQTAQRGKRDRLAAAVAVAACQQAAQRSEALAQSLRAPATPRFGQLAAEHVRARELAHASCASATAAVLQQEEGSERTARLAELAGYRELWQRVPPAGG
ncbi:MAG TPA: hypothetical protein VFS67_32450 [Polyangiaceae bacterium]|nr:hypothetical protein [Polyangiaceae bacterium]